MVACILAYCLQQFTFVIIVMVVKYYYLCLPGCHTKYDRVQSKKIFLLQD